MKKSNRIRPLTQGFTLLELALVLGIVAVLVSVLLPKGLDALRNARVQQVAKTVDTLKTALVSYLTLPGGNGSIPRTEGTGIPTSGAALTAASDTAKGDAARLDTVLLTSGVLEKPLNLRMGNQVYTSTGPGNDVAWSQSALAFLMTPDAAPSRDWSAVTRVEARSSTPGLAPSTALGANFRPDGVNDLKANLVVAYLVIPNTPAKDAFDLALQLNGAQLAPLEGAACDIGQVAYAAPANGVTDVYILLATV
jgi:prepilin-type N-terminal cleavage/methylation domain-containing protein